jgi:MoaA/NifB/PqqE/SkfB family radical SAM enzyme
MTTAFPRFFEFHSITVLTSDKCKAKCDHCCVSSSPTRKTAMDFAQIRASLEPLLETHPIKVVVFSGGEPSLLKNDLVKAIAFCAARCIQTRVVTNASWAIDVRRTESMLKRWRDAGLPQIA